MKKVTSILMCFIVCFTMLSFYGCGKAEEETAQPTKGSLLIGIDSARPPYSYISSNGSYIGFDIDLAKAACEVLGYEAVFTPVSWDENHIELENKTVDCLWTCMSIEGNEDRYLFSEPYMKTRQYFVTKKSSGINTAKDVQGKKVAAMTSTAAMAVLISDEKKEFCESLDELYCLQTTKECFNFLSYGKTDAILTEYFSAEYYTRNKSDYKIIYEPIMENHIAVAFRQTDTDLCSEISSAIQQLKDNGKLEEIAKCWGVNKKISAS